MLFRYRAIWVLDQCDRPVLSGGDCFVSARMRERAWPDISRGLPVDFLLSSAAKPPSWYRCSHLYTVTFDVPIMTAISGAERPSSCHRTICARDATEPSYPSGGNFARNSARSSSDNAIALYYATAVRLVKHIQLGNTRVGLILAEPSPRAAWA